MHSGNFYYADPTGNVPYEERQWIYGIHDCYSLVRDFHRREFDIVLDDFDRGEELEWQSKDWQMFSRNYAKQGFRRIDRPSQKGDVLLMQIDAPFPNHVGVMTGDGILFYHHLMDRLSEKAIWGGMWEKVTSYVLRHESL
jgi:cell wall-associated NlpC family hydrolase